MGSNSKRNTSKLPPCTSNTTGSTVGQTMRRPSVPIKTLHKSPSITTAPSQNFKLAPAVISVNNQQPTQLPPTYSYHQNDSRDDVSSSSSVKNKPKKAKKENNENDTDDDNWDENMSDLETNTSELAKQLEDELGQVLSNNSTTAQTNNKKASRA